MLHYGFKAEIRRATMDIDFGIQVDSWKGFEKLKTVLLEKNFKETREAQRLVSPVDIPVELIPFGGIEDKHSCIQWPPKGGMCRQF